MFSMIVIVSNTLQYVSMSSSRFQTRPRAAERNGGNVSVNQNNMRPNKDAANVKICKILVWASWERRWRTVREQTLLWRSIYWDSLNWLPFCGTQNFVTCLKIMSNSQFSLWILEFVLIAFVGSRIHSERRVRNLLREFERYKNVSRRSRRSSAPIRFLAVTPRGGRTVAVRGGCCKRQHK